MANAPGPNLPDAPPIATGGDDGVRWPHAVALWCLIMASESINGSLRELYLKPWLGTATAAQVGFATATGLVVFIAWLFAPWLRAANTRSQLRVGVIWAALTFAFEALLAFGLGSTPGRFLADYDPARGGLMAFGLLVLLLAPMIGSRLHSALALSGRLR